MFRLRIGYLLSGIATGLILLFGFLGTLPDGKLHITFCDVGQGDAAYIRFPDGRDMLVDAGPNDKVLGCLGSHMPFWDRVLDIVVLTHPQKDHMQGLLSVFERYDVGYFIRSDIANSTEGYQKLIDLVKKHAIKEKFVTTRERITVGKVALNVLWPSTDQIAHMNFTRSNSSVLGASSITNLNDGSIVFWLRYGSFDAIFPGDATLRPHFAEAPRGFAWRADNVVEVLKVPHHGSKTGMSEAFLDWLNPQLAVISVGKNNTYGHPAEQILGLLQQRNIRALRTDQEGEIEVVSDGKGWRVLPL